MSPRPEALHTSIAAAAAYVRRHAGIALLLGVLSAFALALLLAFALGAQWAQPTPLPLLIDVLLIALVAGVLLYWRRVLRPRLGSRQVAEATEVRHGLAAGALRGLLELHENVPEGSSPALLARAERTLAAKLAGQGSRSLAGDLGDGWQRRVRALGGTLAGAVLVLGTLAFASPERSRAGWSPLLHPVKQLLPPPLAPLMVLPGNAEVQRGEDLAVRVRAEGRSAVLLRWRLEGDVVRERVLAVAGDSAQGTIADVNAAGEYWVEAPDGAKSVRYTLTPVDALLLSDLIVDVLYPAYLSLTPEHYEGELPLLELPAGTTLRISGRTTRPLRMAALQGASATVPLHVDGQSFVGRWTPAESGMFTWVVRDESNSGLAITPAPVEIVIVPDMAPSVDLTFPGVDTTFEPDLRQALAADARDDHGVVNAVVVSWKVSSSGQREPPVESVLPLEQLGDRVVLRTVLDASARGLVPGDTLRYFVRVTDSSPARQTGVSATHSLRLPTAEELRERAEREAEAMVSQAEQAAKRAGEIERQTRNAERNAQASNARRSSRNASGGGQPGQQDGKMQFQETQEARKVLEQQQSLMQQVEQMKGALEALEKSMTEAGLRDQELQRKMEELRALYDKLQTPEMRRQLEELQKSIEKLSPEEMEKALEKLAEQQKQLKEQLEKSLEMMKKAAAEQEMNALSQQAKELSTQQEALAKEHEEEKQSAEESKQRASQQEKLAEKSDELSRQMGKLGEELAKQGEAEASQRTKEAAEQAGQAQEEMKKAAESAQEQRGKDAAEQGRKAAEQLREAAEQLDATRRQMSDGARQKAEESMQQATRDALSLAQRQQELQQQMQAAKQGEQQQQQGGQSQSQPQQQAGQQGEGQKTRQPGQQTGQQQGAQKGGQRPQQAGGEQEGPQQGSKSGQGQQSGAGQQGGGGGQSQQQPDLAQMRAQQGALQQGLEQLGRNLSETGQQSGMVNQEVGAAMNRATSSMQQTQQGLQQAQQGGQLPTEQAQSAVDALNRLALSLLNNTQQIQQSQGGGGTTQAMQQLADLAKQQGSVNGQSTSLQQMGVSQASSGDEARRLGQDQQQIAQQLSGLNNMLGGREDALGEIDALAKEADAIARELQGGRMPPEVLARQERLFHRLLDAGRSLEREETSEERNAERPGNVAGRAVPGALDPRLLDSASRYRVPSADELRAMPPAYRKLILDYFERLNRPAPPKSR